jgi:protocatechuate 3,4-dioxygenase beta subunit
VCYSFRFVDRRRRSLLLLIVVAAMLAVGSAGGTGAAAATCRPTPDDGAGPFGRGAPPLRSKTGTGHVLTGVVLSAFGCTPLRGAQVQLWQANRNYEYVRRLSATVLTDRSGRFRYESPLPVSHEGRPPHIHLRVIARGHEPLLTRYVLVQGTKRGHVRLVLVPLDL